MKWWAQYWVLSVGFALVKAYRELTGRDIHLELGEEATEDLQSIAELVCKRTGMDYKRFQQFFDSLKNPQGLTDGDFMRFAQFSEELLKELHGLKTSITTEKQLGRETPLPQEKPKKNPERQTEQISQTSPYPHIAPKGAPKRMIRKTAPLTNEERPRKVFPPPEDVKQLRMLLNAQIACEKVCAHPRWKAEFGSLTTQKEREKYILQMARVIANHYKMPDAEPLVQTLKEIIRNKEE